VSRLRRRRRRKVPLTVPDGTPLAGYGSFRRRLLVPDVLDRYPHAFWFKPGRAERDPLARGRSCWSATTRGWCG